MQNELAWTAQNGAAIRVIVSQHNYELFVNDTKAFTGLVTPVPAAVATKAHAVRFDALTEMHDLEMALEDARHAVLAHAENPAIAYEQQAKAQDALDAWSVANVTLWAQEMERRKAAFTARQAEIASRWQD